MSEENILCVFSPFIGGALITVQVKLNMSEISRAAGVDGKWWWWWGGGVDNQGEAGAGKSL